jgi:hypothetical protein
VNCGGDGVVFTGSSTTRTVVAVNCTIANNGGTGFKGNATASQTGFSHQVISCLITGSVAFGIDGQSAARIVATSTRLRDNASGDISGLLNYPTDFNNYTTDSDDATEYVSTGANGDFRIKNTAAIWGQGYGAGDESAAAGVRRHPGMSGGLSA